MTLSIVSDGSTSSVMVLPINNYKQIESITQCIPDIRAKLTSSKFIIAESIMHHTHFTFIESTERAMYEKSFIL